MKSQSLLLLLLIATFQLSAQNVLTLDMAIDKALENNYSIKIARNNKKIADNNLSYGNAGFLPTVAANVNKTLSTQSFDREFVSGDKTSATGIKNENTQFGASLNWTIFDGMRMFTTYNQLEELKLQSEESLQAEIELLVYNITATFYQAALERERLTRYDSNVLLSEQRLKVARDKYDLGRASKLEFLQAQVDLNADKSLRIQQEQLLAARKLELNRLMTIEDTTGYTLQFVLENNDNLVLADLLENLQSQNPMITAMKREKTIAEYNAKINQGERLPTLNFNAQYSNANNLSPAGVNLLENTTRDISYGLSASWILFNGFNINRRIQNAKIQSDNSELLYNSRLLDYNTALKTRYIDYVNSLELMALEQENLDVARENNEISRERYEIGLSTPLELREAQLNFLDAELRFQNAAFNAKLAAIELKYLFRHLTKIIL